MSYILDALRKSEHERQKNTGLNASLLYPLEMRRSNMRAIVSALLATAAVAGAAFAWWPRPAPPSPVSSSPIPLNPVAAPHATPMQAASTPPAVPVIAASSSSVQSAPPALHIAAAPAKATLTAPASPPRLERHLAQTTPLAQQKILLPAVSSTQPTVTVEPLPPPPAKTASADPLQNLPPLNITGFLQNEQGTYLAIINNQLVHEGEEISPGLRLVKILDGSAVFSYKGFVFSR